MSGMLDHFKAYLEDICTSADFKAALKQKYDVIISASK